MGTSGNRFGGITSFRDTLGDYMMKRELGGMARSRLGQVPASSGVGLQSMGYGGQPGTMMTSGPSSSADFNERKKSRRLYGKYGKGGLEREKLGAEKRMNATNAAKGRAEFGLKLRKDAREERLAKAKIAGGLNNLGMPAGAPQVREFRGGAPLGTPPPSTADQFPPDDISFRTRPSGTGTIRVPGDAWDSKIAAPGAYSLNAKGRRRFTPLTPTVAPIPRPAPGLRVAPTYKPTRVNPTPEKNPQQGPTDLWGSGGYKPKGKKTLWDDLKEYLDYAKRRSF